MINYIKLKINNFLQKNFGLIFISNKTYTEYIKFNFIDLRTISSEVHYSQLKNITQQKANFIINIPTSKIMYSPIQAIWIQTLRIYQNEIHSNQKTNFKKEKSFQFFSNYFETFQPNNVAELLELELNDIGNNKAYFEKNPRYAVYPWSNSTCKQEYNRMFEVMQMEFKERGINDYKKSDGVKTFGPVSKRLVEMEYHRLIALYNSIKENGIIDHPDHIFMQLFINGENYLYANASGFHRTAVLIVLNYEEIPVKVNLEYLVAANREEVDNWPHVKDKLYTKEQALCIFNNRFFPLIDVLKNIK